MAGAHESVPPPPQSKLRGGALGTTRGISVRETDQPLPPPPRDKSGGGRGLGYADSRMHSRK